MAWLELDKGYLVCVGTEEEARTADANHLVEMVALALTYAKYNSLTTSSATLN